MEAGFVVAFVSSIVRKGNHGPYALIRDVVDADEVSANIKEIVVTGGSVTFALTPPTWCEQDLPEPGTKVVLWDFRQKRSGWRAMSARYFRPADQQPQRGRKRA